MRFKGLALQGGIVLLALGIIGQYVFIRIPIIGFFLKLLTASWFPDLMLAIIYSIALIMLLLAIVTRGATFRLALGFLFLGMSWDIALVVIGRTPAFLRIFGTWWLTDIFFAPAKVLTEMLSGVGPEIGKVYFPLMSVLTGSDVPLVVFLLAYPELVGVPAYSLVVAMAVTGMAIFLLVDKGFYNIIQALIILTIGYIFGAVGLTFYKVPALTELFQYIYKLGPLVDPIQVLFLVFLYTMLTGDSRYWKIGKIAFSLYFLALAKLSISEWIAFIGVFIGIPFFADLLLGTTGVSLFSSLDFLGMSKIIAKKSISTIRITRRNIEKEKEILSKELERRIGRAEKLENRILLTAERYEELMKKTKGRPGVKGFVLKRTLEGLKREYEAEITRINEIQRRLSELGVSLPKRPSGQGVSK